MENHIEDLVINGAGQQFIAKDFRSLLLPGIYILMRGEECLYIGMSGRLLGRIGGRHHQKRAMRECDKVLLFPCKSKEAANALETILIGKMKPKYNLSKRRWAVNKILGNVRNFNHDHLVTG